MWSALRQLLQRVTNKTIARTRGLRADCAIFLEHTFIYRSRHSQTWNTSRSNTKVERSLLWFKDCFNTNGSNIRIPSWFLIPTYNLKTDFFVVNFAQKNIAVSSGIRTYNILPVSESIPVWAITRLHQRLNRQNNWPAFSAGGEFVSRTLDFFHAFNV